MKEITGTCKFCGQGVLIAIPDCADEAVARHEAAMTCKCSDARKYQADWEEQEKLEMAKTSAEGTTFELFNEDYPEIEQLLNKSIDMIAAKKIKKVTINTHGKTKASITMSNGTFIVEREDKSIARRETEI